MAGTGMGCSNQVRKTRIREEERPREKEKVEGRDWFGLGAWIGARGVLEVRGTRAEGTPCEGE